MIKPMLAGKAPSLDKIQFPVLATPKLDGIRCLVLRGEPVSRSLKPIPNEYVRHVLKQWSHVIEKFDGELVVPEKRFNEISSAIMSRDGRPDFRYKVFDIVMDLHYTGRIDWLKHMYNNYELPGIVEPLFPRMIMNKEELEAYEELCIAEGHEGVMIRHPYGPYKYGRSTTKEGWLLKIKRFEDSEAVIVGFEELQRNNNPEFTGELGQAKHSSCQYGMVAGGTLGALVVKDLKTGVMFNIGTGLNDDIRETIWYLRDKYLGRIIKYKYQPHGSVDKPRSPVFLGFRHEDDL